MSETQPTAHRMRRKYFVFAILACAIIAVAAANSTWLEVGALSVLGKEISVTASGQDVSPGLTAAGLVAIAAALFLSISGRIGKYIALTLAGAAGVLVLIASIFVLNDPRGAIVTQFADATGSDAVPDSVTLGFPLWITVLAAVALIVVAFVGLVVARQWHVAGSKYDRAQDHADEAKSSGRPNDEITTDERDMWDSLSDGIDPSDK